MDIHILNSMSDKDKVNTNQKPTVCKSGEVSDSVRRISDFYRLCLEVERCQLTKRLHINQSLQVHS